MAKEKDTDPVFSKGVIEFLTVANEYCLFTEKTEQYTKEDIILYYVKICPLLYIKGILLPQLEENESEITERYVNEENWEIVFQSLKRKIGEEDIFWDIDHDHSNDKIIRKLSISEHIADVYQDLKDFIMLYQKNTLAAKENAVAECNRLFETHWGDKIIRIQKALHEIIFHDHSDDSSDSDLKTEL